MKTIEERLKYLETNGVPGLRDFFASSALSILGNNTTRAEPEDIATYCYKVADAMLKERERTSVK